MNEGNVQNICDLKQVYLHAQCTSTLIFWWPYKKWWYIIHVVHELLYGEHLMKWIINVQITYSLKNSDLFFEHIYMRLEVNSNRFEILNRFKKSFHLHGNFTTANLEISNPFQKLFRLHGDFTAATFETIVKFKCTCANDSF